MASSVPAERVFSKAGELLSKKTTRLKDNKVNKILFLNSQGIMYMYILHRVLIKIQLYT